MASFTGSAGDDIFTGGVDSDTASGAGGNDRLTGADGSDVLIGGAGSDTLDGGAGDDTLYSGDQSPQWNFPYYGNPYSLPRLEPGADRDTLIGGDGSDRIFAGYGDSVDGGPGGSYGDYLFISFQGAPTGVTADFGQATLTIGGGVITGIENISYVQGSQFDDNLNVRAVNNNGYSDRTTVNGMGGNDTLTAGYYTAVLYGDDGNDLLDGRTSQYLQGVEGGAGDDTLQAGAGLGASANGGDGDDTIYAGGVVRGGAGDDTIFMQFSYYGGLTYGDEGDDRVTTSSSGNRVAGGSGADTLLGGEGADALFSADFVNNGQGPGDDNGLERDRLSGGGGNDTLAAGYGDDVDGGGGTDTLYLSLGGASQGATVDLSGMGSGGPVTVGGGVIQGIESLIYLRGSEAADNIRLPTQGVMITVTAGGGNDTITSQGSSASILGGSGDDRLVSGPAADTFDGGSGIDIVDYSTATAGVAVNLRNGVGGNGDTLFSVEAVVGSAFADTLTGASNASGLSGGAGNDRIEVGFRDVAQLGSGSDLVYVLSGTNAGGAQANAITVTDWNAEDRLQFGTTTGAYTETTASDFAGALQAAQAQAAAGYNFVSVQVASDVFVFGAPISGRSQFDAAVRLVGTTLDAVSASNVGLTGTLEPPTPTPTPTPPTPTPTPTPTPPTPTPTPTPTPPTPTPPTPGGGMTLTGGATADRLFGGTGNDVLNGLGGNDVLTGDLGDDSLSGGDGDDELQGAAGADTILGGSGSDNIQGFAGNDFLDGGTGTDRVSFLNAASGVTVSLSLSGPQNTAGDGVDTVANFENIDGSNFGDVLTGDGQANELRGWGGDDTLNGGAGNDTLDAREGADVLNGGDGDDHLMGSIGADVMTGGAGADVFEFNLTGDAVANSATGGATAILDRILDWSSADFLQFWGAATANAGNYREISASGYDSALSQAQGGYTEFGIEYTAAQVGGDVVVFAPRHNQAIVLSGRTLDDISASNLGPTPGAAPVTPTPPTPPTATPTAGNDSLTATAANSEIHAGLGNDTIVSGNIITYLRGDEGNDSIAGGSDFDDINGNMGDDTATGGLGDDWVVGGKDNDTLSGDAGSDLVYGNIGADTCDGGAGADIVRGGQDNDIVRGGTGDDFVSGDKGDDTMTGGSGADIFHTFGESGLDRVTDFSLAEGDRVMLDPGTQYTVIQSGADTVINMVGGGQMILVGVQMSTLSAGWIFGA